MLDSHFSFADTMRFKPVQFGNSDVTIGQTDGCNSFQFGHLPAPYRFRRGGRMRILLPTAMISISVISLMISKCIKSHYTLAIILWKCGLTAGVMPLWGTGGWDCAASRRSSGTSPCHFAGTNPKPCKLLETAQTPTSRVHTVLAGILTIERFALLDL